MGWGTGEMLSNKTAVRRLIISEDLMHTTVIMVNDNIYLKVSKRLDLSNVFITKNEVQLM